MATLSIAFDIIIVGAMALPWVLLDVHLFFSEGETSLKKLLRLGGRAEAACAGRRIRRSNLGLCCPLRPTGAGFRRARIAPGTPPCASFGSRSAATGNPWRRRKQYAVPFEILPSLKGGDSYWLTR